MGGYFRGIDALYVSGTFSPQAPYTCAKKLDVKKTKTMSVVTEKNSRYFLVSPTVCGVAAPSSGWLR
jgi:hypothetical protein